MKKFLPQFLALSVLFLSPALGAQSEEFPNISGDVLFQFQADRILSTQKEGLSSNNAFVYIEPNMALNFNKQWSIKTDLRLQPNDVLTTRDSVYPERYRTFLRSDRGFNTSEMGLIIEELKLHFENEDMKFFAGKFDPTFGTAYNKAKRIGIFTSQFTEDYNLREKIGFGGAALLENSKITLNTFFNDTTDLSRSALNDRGRAARNDGLAGNTETLSSFSLSFDGEHPFGIENWFYNIGYRSLGVDSMDGRSRETGYNLTSEYSYDISPNTTLIPLVELVKINNFTGEQGRDAIYTTFAVMAKYSSWNASVSHLTRNIKQPQRSSDVSDRQLQFSVGYKFTNNIALDVTRSRLKEDGNAATLIGANLSYLYQF